MRLALGIFTRTFVRDTLEQVLDAVAEHGMASVQLNTESAGMPTMPDELGDAVCDGIRQALAARGIRLAALSGTYNMVHPDRRERDLGMRRLRVLAAACERLDTSVITLCTGTRDPDYMWRRHPDNDSPEAWADLLSAMEQVVEIAQDHGVIVAFETEVNNVVDSAIKARRLLDEIGSPNLKVVMDGANLFHAGELADVRGVLDRAFDLLGGDIALAHAKDLSHDGDAGHEAAGTGLLDYTHYLRLLTEAEFEGSLVLHSLDESQVRDSLAFVRSKWPTD